MDISTLMLTDIALNLIGYLAAGALAVLIYAAFRRDRRQAATSQPAGEEVAEAPAPIRRPERSKVEFVRLGEEADPSAAITGENLHAVDNPQFRRDRSEIFRVAHRMLDAGASQDRIRLVLPISEAELALLNLTRN